jgi:hypothetical protein
MFQMHYRQLGQQIHNERTQAARSARPEWPTQSIGPEFTGVTWLRVRLARALGALPASIRLDPPEQRRAPIPSSPAD